MIIYYKQKSLEMPLNKEKPCISARFPLVRIMGLDRLLRILIACRPLALPTVPACAALPKKQCTTLFLFTADPLGFKS